MEIVKELCPVCNKEFSLLSSHLTKMKDEKHMKYKEKLYSKIDSLLLETDLYFYEISNKLKEEGFCAPVSVIHKRSVDIYPGRGYEISAIRKTGDNNPAKRDEVRQKISNTVAKQWEYGTYENRENGMLGKKGKYGCNFNLYTWMRNRYSQIYKHYHGDKLKCSYPNCTKQEDNNVINVHHIDENTDNFLLSNLEALCVFHHTDKHYGSRKTEFVTITKRFTFDASHNLLNYNGKCVNLHGHTYFLEISIKKRIDMHTGMVMDFGDLKKIVTKYILDRLDHHYTNEVISYLNPTAENMVHWIWEVLEKEALLKGLNCIKLWETPDSYVELTKQDMLESAQYVFNYYQEMYKHWNWEYNNES